jgi:hypothetical protein
MPNIMKITVNGCPLLTVTGSTTGLRCFAGQQGAYSTVVYDSSSYRINFENQLVSCQAGEASDDVYGGGGMAAFYFETYEDGQKLEVLITTTHVPADGVSPQPFL